MQAREFLDAATDADLIVRLASYSGDQCVGRGRALIIDRDNRIAMMLEDCGDPIDTGAAAGSVVCYFQHPEAESRITGSPASVRA